MEHVVFFPAHDGSPAFRRVGSLEDAVRLVEHLRNVEGVDRVTVHALTEVPLEFRAWYRVEMPGTTAAQTPAVAPDAPAAEAAPAEVAAVEVPAVEVPAPAVPEQERPVADPPARSSLGFFAR